LRSLARTKARAGLIQTVGWVEPKAKPIIFMSLQLMGFASLYPSYAANSSS
jgi:hypothetical protein